jgi:hypothetical protein
MSNEGNKFKELVNKLLTPEQKAEFKKFMGENPAFTAPTPAPSTTPAVFGQGKLKDGTVVKYDTETLAVGSTVMVVTGEGQELPAPAGEHTLEDGTVIIVDETGKVLEVKASTPEAPVVQEQAATNPLVDALRQLMEGKFESANKEIENSKKEVETLKATVAEQAKHLDAFRTFFSSLIELPTEAPSSKPEEFVSKKRNKVLSYIN